MTRGGDAREENPAPRHTTTYPAPGRPEGSPREPRTGGATRAGSRALRRHIAGTSRNARARVTPRAAVRAEALKVASTAAPTAGPIPGRFRRRNPATSCPTRAGSGGEPRDDVAGDGGDQEEVHREDRASGIEQRPAARRPTPHQRTTPAAPKTAGLTRASATGSIIAALVVRCALGTASVRAVSASARGVAAPSDVPSWTFRHLKRRAVKKFVASSEVGATCRRAERRSSARFNRSDSFFG